MSRHDKFKAYWESVGKPKLEVSDSECDWEDCQRPEFYDEFDYRIKGDPNWELRREWVDSDFTLPIEYFGTINQRWKISNTPTWYYNFKYRKAKTTSEITMNIEEKIKQIEEQINELKSEIEQKKEDEQDEDLIPYGTELNVGQPILVSMDKQDWYKRNFYRWEFEYVVTMQGHSYKYAKYDRSELSPFNWLPNNGKMPEAKSVIVCLKSNEMRLGHRLGHPDYFRWDISGYDGDIKEYLVIEK